MLIMNTANASLNSNALQAHVTTSQTKHWRTRQVNVAESSRGVGREHTLGACTRARCHVVQASQLYKTPLQTCV